MDDSIKFRMELEAMINKPRILYDFPQMKKSKEHLISQHLPFPKKLHDNFINPLSRTINGQVVKTQGYFSQCSLSITKEIIKSKSLQEFQNQHNLYFGDGSFTYKLDSSLYGIESDIYVISSASMKPDIGQFYIVTLKKLKELNRGHLFYLQDYEPSFIRMPESDLDFPVLNLKHMRKYLLEVSPSIKNEHVGNAILSNYVGSETSKNKVDGVGSSYIASNVKQDLIKIRDCLYGDKIRVQDFGVHNVFAGTMQEIDALRAQSMGKFRNISWNIRSYSDLENLKGAEFKYTLGSVGLDIQDTRDLGNNQGFIQSLLFYINKDKILPANFYGKIINTTLKEILEWCDKGEENMISKLISGNIDIQVARIGSYYLSFDTTEDFIIKNVKETISHNIGDIIEQLQKQKMFGIQAKGGVELEKEVDIKIKFAFYASDGSEQGIIESFMDKCGYAEKRAKEILNELKEKGLLFFDGNRYRWTHEANINLK